MMLDAPNATSPNRVLREVDTLDLTGAGEFNNPGGSVLVDYDAQPSNGTVRFLDANGVETGSLRFENIKTIIEDVSTFVPNVLIATPKGEVPIENLKVGDRVITRDNGLQDIKWIGHRRLSEEELLLSPRLRPVMIRAGALGAGVPENNTMLSPHQRVLVPDTKAAGPFGDNAVLIAALDLTDLPGIELMDPQDIRYVHLIFGGHEVVLCNGSWIESFHAGDTAFRGAGNAQRLELLELYPELRNRKSVVSYEPEQQVLKTYRA